MEAIRPIIRKELSNFVAHVIMSSLLPLLRCGLSSLATPPSLSFPFFLHISAPGRFLQAATGYRFVAMSQSNGCLCANSVAFCTGLRICGSFWRPGLELLVVFLFVVWSGCACFGYCLVDEVLASGAFLCSVYALAPLRRLLLVCCCLSWRGRVDFFFFTCGIVEK